MKLIILGRPISKKNSRQLGIRGGRIMNRPSGAYEQFRQDALKQLTLRGKVNPPYEISYLFCMKGKMDTDLDNMIAGINDILQEKGILTNDKAVTTIHAAKKGGCKDWETHIEIEHDLLAEKYASIGKETSRGVGK